MSLHIPNIDISEAATALNPSSYAAICAPLVKADEPSHYRPISWSEFRNGRTAGDHADQGEEIQIPWYRQAWS